MQLELLTNGEGLDQEWIELILVARDMGISTEEIREFLLEGK